MLPGGISLYAHQVCLRSIRVFVVAACKHLVTVVTVENQHVNHPPVHLLDEIPTQSVNLLLGSRTKQNNPLNRVCLDILRHSIDTPPTSWSSSLCKKARGGTSTTRDNRWSDAVKARAIARNAGLPPAINLGKLYGFSPSTQSRPVPAELMDAHDISPVVNSAKYDGPDCIDRFQMPRYLVQAVVPVVSNIKVT